MLASGQCIAIREMQLAVALDEAIFHYHSHLAKKKRNRRWQPQAWTYKVQNREELKSFSHEAPDAQPTAKSKLSVTDSPSHRSCILAIHYLGFPRVSRVWSVVKLALLSAAFVS